MISKMSEYNSLGLFIIGLGQIVTNIFGSFDSA